MLEADTRDRGTFGFRPAGFALLVALGLFAGPARATEVDSDLRSIFESTVFKVRAVETSGTLRDGSAVLAGPGRLVTTCHTTRRAKTIEVIGAAGAWHAYPVFADTRRDVCVLSVPELANVAPAVMAETDELKLEDVVFAVGYPRGERLSISDGRVKGLHRYENARVIQVSAPFAHGQSGGALFDLHGRLIGITAFKARSGGDFHFALPLDWVKQEITSSIAGQSMSADTAFWESPRNDQPLFLQAASLEADGKWEALSYVARQWTSAESQNPCSWLALGRAFSRLNRERDAAIAFQRAAELTAAFGTGR